MCTLLRKGVVLCLLSSLCLLSPPAILKAQGDDAPWHKDFIDTIGGSLYFLAWPSATYEKVSFGGFSEVSGGVDVKAKLHGKNLLGSPLWTEVVVEVRGGQVTNVRWGKNNAVAMQPGQTMTLAGEILKDLTSEYNAAKSDPFSRKPRALTAEGARRYQKQCDEGDSYACWRLMEDGGDQVTDGGLKAAKIASRQCELGNMDECVFLGAMYEGITTFRGSGLPRDGRKAMELYAKACAANNAGGCHKVADGYRIGLIGPVDYRQAIQYYQIACDGNVDMACFNLGSMYLDGLGVAKNPQQSFNYYDLTCRLGKALGCEYRGHVTRLHNISRSTPIARYRSDSARQSETRTLPKLFLPEEYDLNSREPGSRDLYVYYSKYVAHEFARFVYVPQSRLIYAQIVNGTWYDLGYPVSDRLHPRASEATQILFSRTGVNPETGVRELLTQQAVPLYQSGRFSIGVTLRDLEGFTFQGKRYSQGVEVIGVIKNMPGAAAGLRAGDIIFKLDQSEPLKTADVIRLVKASGGASMDVFFIRNDQSRLAKVKPVDHANTF